MIFRLQKKPQTTAQETNLKIKRIVTKQSSFLFMNLLGFNYFLIDFHMFS